MTHEDVQRWLDAYVSAWFSYDAEAIGALFSADAEYRYQPWQAEPLRGRDAIVADWLSPDGDPAKRDAPGTVEAAYRPYAVDGDRAVAVGDTAYREQPGGPIERRYSNAWLMEFDADGRCRSFTEYYVKHR
jgi:ketosteroid isomerase-like protein